MGNIIRGMNAYRLLKLACEGARCCTFYELKIYLCNRTSLPRSNPRSWILGRRSLPGCHIFYHSVTLGALFPPDILPHEPAAIHERPTIPVSKASDVASTSGFHGYRSNGQGISMQLYSWQIDGVYLEKAASTRKLATILVYISSSSTFSADT